MVVHSLSKVSWATPKSEPDGGAGQDRARVVAPLAFWCETLEMDDPLAVLVSYWAKLRDTNNERIPRQNCTQGAALLAQ